MTATTSRYMRAMRLEKPDDIQLSPLAESEIEVPEPQGDEVRIQVGACGLCRTDLHIIEGELPLPKLPLVPGHQIVGVVDACGPKSRQRRKGDRVGVPWLYESCGACEYCRQGRENLCDRGRFTGFHADGGYAEFMVAREEFVYPIPQGFPDVEAAPLLCAGIIGYRALRLSEVRSGEILGLYGFGASAHIAIQAARYRGCQVCVFTRSEKHQELARRLGAAWTGRAEETPPSLLHSAIIFAPAGYLVPEALRCLRKGGTLALAGIHMSPIPQLEYSTLYHERTIRSVANATREDAKELLALAGKIPIQTEIETFPLNEANHALLLLRKSTIRGAGVLEVHPTL